MNSGSRFWVGVLLVGTAIAAVAAIFLNGILTFQQHAEESPGTVIVGAKDLPEGSLERFDVTFGPTYLVHGNGSLVRVGNGSTLDLVALQGPRWGEVTNGSVPSGDYAGLVLTFQDASARTTSRDDPLLPGAPDATNASTTPVEVPSRALRVDHAFHVAPKGTVTLVVDVDLPQSVHRDDAGELRFTPWVMQLHDSTLDADGDGVDDVRDWDDDGDGVLDFADDDRDGDGEPDDPAQRWMHPPGGRV